MAQHFNYDPTQIVITWNGIQLLGYAEGTFVSIERNEDVFAPSVGSQGDVTRVRSRDKTGRVTVTLQAESATNDLLSAAQIVDEEIGFNEGPLQIKNLNGTLLCSADISWIVRPANVEYGDEATNREWMFDCSDLKMLVGGAVA